MPNYDMTLWSTVPANNATADPGINWQEGQTRASLNDSARATMAGLAFFRNLTNGSITTTGSANAQAFTSGISYIAVPTNLRVFLKMGFTNTGACTLNMDAIGAVSIKRMDGSDPVANDLVAGAYQEFIYNGTNWILLQAASLIGTGGNQTLLNTMTAANSASLDDTTSITSLYDLYEFQLDNLVPAVGAGVLQMLFQVSAAFQTTNYLSTLIAGFASGTGGPGSGVNTYPSGILLSGRTQVNPVDTTAGLGLTGEVKLHSPSKTNVNKFAVGTTCWYVTSGGVAVNTAAIGGTYTGSQAAVTGVRFIYDTGNITSGIVRVYGKKTS